MSDVSYKVVSSAEMWLCITTLIYFVMNGAQIFETFVIIPKWTAFPPNSFHYFKGEYGLDLKAFWVTIHTIHEITFLTAIILCWNLDIRNSLLILFAIHFAVRIWTILFFAPQLISFQKTANTNEPIPNIKRKATLWKNLNYLRVAIFIAVSLGLIAICIKTLHLKINL